MNLKKLVKKGIDRNIVVYDTDAKEGVLTKRLISLMRVIAYRNGRKILVKVIVPWGTRVEDDFAKYVSKTRGVKFEMSQEYTDFLTGALNGILPKNKVKCLIGICEDDSVLLGAY